MSLGGARNRSGPPADPSSGRSEVRGYKLTALPYEGYAGEVPEFPLPAVRVYNEYFDGNGKKVREFDEGGTEARQDREMSLWQWAWSTPQACAWSMQSWRWHAVAMWVRTAALCESEEATAADKNSVHRFADQIGLTPAGLRENGWAIAENEVGAKSAEKSAAPVEDDADDPRARLAMVPGGGS